MQADENEEAEFLAQVRADAIEVDEFSLKPYSLRLKRPDHNDEIHPHLRITTSYRRGEEQTLTSARLSLTLNAAVPSGCLLLRSPIAVALICQERGATRRSTAEYAAALSGRLLRDGHLSTRQPNYRADLRALYDLLSPRADAASLRQFYMISNEKMQRNVFASQCDAYGVGASASAASASAAPPYVACLLALGSLANHACAPACSVRFDYDLDEACFVALRPLGANEELTIAYGPWPIDCAAARAALLSFRCRCRCCDSGAPPSLALLRCDWLPRSAHCWWCGQPTPRQCGACRRAGYCSVECQRADLPMHRQLCARVAALPDQPPPVYSLPLIACAMFGTKPSV